MKNERQNMRKTFVLLIVIIFVFVGTRTFAVFSNQSSAKAQSRKAFEQRLNLSPKQKEMAREIHKKGSDQIKPVFYEIEMKRQEIDKVKLSDAPEQVKQEKINALTNEIKTLDQKVREIRKENSKEFENILNKKQKKELELMKAEGRAKFEKNHPPRPPFGYFSSPGFWESGRLFPQFGPSFHEQKK